MLSAEVAGIFPLIEKSLEIKGFIHKSVENIELDPDDIDSTICKVISELRRCINRNFEMIKRIRIACHKCDSRYRIEPPLQEGIDEAVR